MPMPGPNTPWPPKEWAPAYAQYAENDAWLTGHVSKLQEFYRPTGGATHTWNGVPHRGGIARIAQRMFWGRPVPAGEQRTRLHVPAAGDLATLASGLQHSDPPVTSFAGDERHNAVAQARLAEAGPPPTPLVISRRGGASFESPDWDSNPD